MKKAIIIHGWTRTPESDWYPWLRRELTARNYSVLVPSFPNTNTPAINPWVNTLRKTVGEFDKDMLLVAHSIGCQTVLRYLEKIKSRGVINQILFVAPWLTLTNLEDQETEEVALPWLTTPINFEEVKKHYKKLIAIFSDNDIFVPLKNKDLFEKKLPINSIILANQGHFTEDDGICKIPTLLKYIDHNE